MLDSPGAYYRMRESSGSPQDSSGSGKHLTTTLGSPVYSQAGPFPGALGIRLPAGSCFRRLTDTALATTVIDNWTIEGWCLFESVDAIRTGFCPASGATGFELKVANPAKWYYARDNLTGQGADAVNALSTTAWQLLHIVRRAGVVEYYYNGALDTASAGGGAPTSPTGGNIEIGGGGGLAWTVSEVAFYASALSAARIATHYAAAFAGNTTSISAISAIGF